MEGYTLKTTKKDLKLGRITEEEYKIICTFIRARDKHTQAEDKMHQYYKVKYYDRIKSTDLKGLEDIKNELRSMPESCSKTLMFRTILMVEDEIKNKVEKI